MPAYSARVIEAARLLQLKPNELRAAAQQWARSAAHDPSQKSLFGSPDTPAQSWAIFLRAGGIKPEPERGPIVPANAPEPKPPPAPKATNFANEALELAKSLPSSSRLGSTKVYLRAIHEAWPDDSLTWEAFVTNVLTAKRAGTLRLSDADALGEVDERLYEESRIEDGGQESRFLNVS